MKPTDFGSCLKNVIKAWTQRAAFSLAFLKARIIEFSKIGVQVGVAPLPIVLNSTLTLKILEYFFFY
jgi:hypothetical protein